MAQEVAAGANDGSPEKGSALPQKELWNKEGDSYLAYGLCYITRRNSKFFQPNNHETVKKREEK